MTNDEGDVMKICCWLSSKGELVTGRLNIFNFAKGRRTTGNKEKTDINW